MNDATITRAQRAVTALKEGRFDAAYKIAKAGLKSAPKQAYLANLAGLALVQNNDPLNATRYFLMAWRSDPQMIEAARNLAQALILLGQTDKALTVLAKALASWPDDVELRYLVASAHHGAGRFHDAIVAANEGITLAPKSAAFHSLRALALEQTGDAIGAERDFQHAIELNVTDPETRRAYAQFLAFHAQIDAAFTHVNVGLSVTPDHEGLLIQKASLHQAIGDTKDAITCYETILREQPEHPLALNGLAFLVSDQRAAQLAKTISKVLRKPSISRETKTLLGFAQAHLAKNAGHKDAAQVLAKANAAASKIMPYDAQAAETGQARLLAPFAGKIGQSTTLPKTPTPIFIVGLIRSGTTLMEQILTQHPAVTGLGELARARHLADIQASQFAQKGTTPDGDFFAQDYRAALPELSKSTTHFVDKMPDNFRVIGYLLNAFPNATILEMQRDPRDVALSMWANHFPTMAHSYTNALPAMAAHMNLYARTMQHWHANFPDRIHAVSYEDLVTDLVPNSQRAATLCGLQWHVDMAHPERGASAVLTASSDQVRQPVHRQSIGKWLDKRDLLAPLCDALDPDLWPGIRAT
ncbi:MAG: sulfotransferase [Sulfitobacter sp.]